MAWGRTSPAPPAATTKSPSRRSALPRRLYLVGDLSLLEYVVNHASDGGGRLEVVTSYRLVAGIGAYL